MMLLRVRSLALGRSGVRPLVAQALVDLLNHDITPWVPEHGSLGASGDLAPLAHCALVLLGEGWVLGQDGGQRIAGSRRAARRRAEPDRAGRQGRAGADQRHRRHARHAAAGHRRRPAPVRDGRRDRGAGHRGDARLGPAVPARAARDPARTRARPSSAANIHRLLQDSAIMDSHRDDLAHAVQDAYSMRCAPQVAGAARDTLDFAARSPAGNWSSVVDNPVVLPDGRVESTGNFHGAPLGFAADFLAIAAAEVGSISERRVDRLLDVSPLPGPAGVPLPRPGGQLRADDRPVHGGRDRRGEPAAGRAGLGRLAARPAACRRTTSRWAGRRPRSCVRVLDNLTSLLAVELLAAVRGSAAAGRRCAVPGRPGRGRGGGRVRRRAGAGHLPGPGAGGRPDGGRRPRPARRDRSRGRPAAITRSCRHLDVRSVTQLADGRGWSRPPLL